MRSFCRTCLCTGYHMPRCPETRDNDEAGEHPDQQTEAPADDQSAGATHENTLSSETSNRTI